MLIIFELYEYENINNSAVEKVKNPKVAARVLSRVARVHANAGDPAGVEDGRGRCAETLQKGKFGRTCFRIQIQSEN